jgi:hypothetical protein
MLLPIIVWPCGIPWPNRLLLDSREELLASPEASLWEEVDRILSEVDVPDSFLHPQDLAVSGPNDSYIDRTSYLEYTQIQEVLMASGGSDPARTEEILSRYAPIRSALSDVVKAASPAEVAQASREYFKSVEIPEEIPEEFRLYLRGAIAYHLGEADLAREEWLRIFDLPEADRAYRSSWAAYMLGKVASGTQEASEWFERTREILVDRGEDPIGLFVASCGLEAGLHYKTGNYAEALDLYAISAAAGSESARLSLKFALRNLVEEGSLEALRVTARNPTTQRLLTAYHISRPYQSARMDPWLFENSGPPLDRLRDQLVNWFTVLKEEGFSAIQGADRLALAAYQVGRMDLAGQWLTISEEDSSLAKWVGAKLALRKGDTAKAERLLSEIAEEEREESLWRDWENAVFFFEYDPENRQDRVWGELGILHLDQGHWAESLDAFLRGNYWMDAAYVAEKVLEVEELREYVDENPDLGANAEGKDLRYLLARRLARNGLSIGTAVYFPAQYRPLYEAYLDHLRISENLDNTEGRRAQALMEAARIARHQGMELFGTEVEPDWTVVGGSWQGEEVSAVRYGNAASGPDWAYDWQPVGTSLQPSDVLNPILQEERERALAHLPFPNQRYHYRYQASALAWKAAEMLPDDSEETALILWEAGSWMKIRDPRYADKFYKALVLRNPTIPLAREADLRRWFPPWAEMENPGQDQ